MVDPRSHEGSIWCYPWNLSLILGYVHMHDGRKSPKIVYFAEPQGTPERQQISQSSQDLYPPTLTWEDDSKSSCRSGCQKIGRNIIAGLPPCGTVAVVDAMRILREPNPAWMCICKCTLTKRSRPHRRWSIDNK